MTGAPSETQFRRNANIVRKMFFFSYTGPWNYSSGCDLIFAEDSSDDLLIVWGSSNEESVNSG